MSKRELISRIMDLNRSARREFLETFTENELAAYLDQLQAVCCTFEHESAVEVQ